MKAIHNIKMNHNKSKGIFASRAISRLFAIAIHLPIISNGEQETQRTGRVLPAAIVGLVAVPVVMLSSVAPVSAASSTLNLDLASDTISVDIGAANANGTFKKSANNTISVTTDHYTGYTLSIKSTDTSASTTSPALKNGSDTMPSITSSLTEEQFSSISATNYNNKYGYLPSRICTNTNDCTSNTSFLPAPTLTGDILDQTSTANPSTANTYTMAIGARIDQTIPFGSYSNTFEVLLVANAIPYTIVYNDGVVSDMPVDVDTTSMTSSVTISSNTPVRDGYTFGGWCTVQVADNESCTGTTYAAGSTYTLDQTGTNNLQLFAMWSGSGASGTTWANAFAAAGKSQSGGYYYIQDADASICENVAVDETISVKDKRDDQVYLIGKLKDNHCWLLDNLRLDLTTVSLENLQGNTNAENSTLTKLKNGGGSSPYTTAAVISTSSFGTSDDAYTAAKINTASKDTINSNSAYNYGEGSHKYGIYYNYCAASAGSYCYASGAGADKPDTIIDASEDICPSNWRMPTGGSEGEYLAVAGTYANNSSNGLGDALKNALSTPLSGYYYSSSAYLQGSYGYFWSSTYRDGHSMYYLRVSQSDILPTNNGTRSLGYSIRCIISGS